ncbi:hypothetical protein FXO38_08558 [Capsicum annuum]|nr:hypothetical protein FXO38_08558 [Capsicum annuum]
MAKQGVALLAEDLQNRYNSIEAIGLTKVDYTPIEVGQYEPQPYDTVGTSCTPSPSPTIAPHPSTSRLAPVDCMIVSQVDLNKVIKRLRIVEGASSLKPTDVSERGTNSYPPSNPLLRELATTDAMITEDIPPAYGTTDKECRA